MATQFELFVNQEMPKRVYTNQFPLTAGHVPVATGVGLEVEARILSASDISDLGSYATQGDLSNVLADANEYADGLVVGLWDDRGAYTVNAAGNINYPSSAGSGVAGALMKGDIFTVAGAVTGVSTVNNIAVNNGDTVRALVDNPSTTNNAHWAIAENNIGYVPENTANKTTNTDLSGAAGTYPDTPTVKSYIDNYDISAAAINSTGTVTLTRTESDLTFQVPTAISGLSFDPNTGVLTSSYTNNAVDTTITVAANEVSDNVFRIKDDTDATKKIAFQASNIGAGQTKTISMPNFDVSLSPIRRRIQTSGTGLENLLLDNTETYIEITGGTTITVPVYPPYTVNAGASGYLFNATNVAKTIRFQHTWSGEISSFVGTCNHFFPETNETGGYTSTVPGSSGNTYTDIQLLPGETLRFVVSGTKTLFIVNIYRNSSNVMYENTFKIKRSALESYGVRFETSAVTDDRVITMPNADVDLGLVGQTDFLDTAFRVSDNTDATKKIAFEASAIGTGKTKTITMPNADVNLGNLVATNVSQTFTLAEQLQAQRNLGLSQGTGTYTVTATNNALWCEDIVLQGTNNTAIKCKGIVVSPNQQFAHFEGLWDIGGPGQWPVTTSETPTTNLLVPIGTRLTAHKGNTAGGDAGAVVIAKFARNFVKTANNSFTIQDSNGVKPYSNMKSGWTSNDPIAVHTLKLTCGTASPPATTTYQIIVGSNSGAGLIISTTLVINVVGSYQPTLTSATITNGRLVMTVEVASPYNSAQVYMQCELTSVYGADL